MFNILFETTAFRSLLYRIPKYGPQLLWCYPPRIAQVNLMMVVSNFKFVCLYEVQHFHDGRLFLIIGPKVQHLDTLPFVDQFQLALLGP